MSGSRTIIFALLIFILLHYPAFASRDPLYTSYLLSIPASKNKTNIVAGMQDYNTAVELLNGPDAANRFPEIVELLNKSADVKNSDALNMLGIIHEKGEIGGKKNFTKAQFFYLRADNFGSSDGTYNAARLYFEGYKELKSDYPKAGEFFVRAASAGSKEAAEFVKLAKRVCSEGENNLDRAVHCIVGAQAGDALSEFRAGMNYLQAGKVKDRKVSNEKGMALVRKAAEKGQPDAILIMAVGYHEGEWVEQHDLVEAYYWANLLSKGDYDEKFIDNGKKLKKFIWEDMSEDQRKAAKKRL